MNPYLSENDIKRLRRQCDTLIAARAPGGCNVGEGGMKALVQYDRENDLLSVGLPGTDDELDIIKDFKMFGGPTEGGVAVHAGFHECMNLIEPHIYRRLLDLDVSSSATIELFGHSLGAAVCLRLVLRSPWFRDSKVTVTPFGCPRVYGIGGEGLFLAQGVTARILRVTNGPDPITKLPPAMFGFRHIYPEYVMPWEHGALTAHFLDSYKKSLDALQPG